MPAFPTPTISPPFDPGQHRERVRGYLALLLFGLVAVEVTVAFVFIGKGVQPDGLRDVFSLVFGATTTLLGSAMGFYFGQMSAAR